MKTNLTFSRKWKGQSEVPRAPEGGRQTSCEGREGPEAQTFPLPSGGGRLTLLGRVGGGGGGLWVWRNKGRCQVPAAGVQGPGPCWGCTVRRGDGPLLSWRSWLGEEAVGGQVASLGAWVTAQWAPWGPFVLTLGPRALCEQCRHASTLLHGGLCGPGVRSFPQNHLPLCEQGAGPGEIFQAPWKESASRARVWEGPGGAGSPDTAPRRGWSARRSPRASHAPDSNTWTPHKGNSLWKVHPHNIPFHSSLAIAPR